MRLGEVLLGLFGLVTLPVVIGWTQALDDWWNSLMTDGETAWLVGVAEFFHHVGAPPIAIPTVVLIAVVFLVMRGWLFAGAWICIVAGSQVLSMISKSMIARTRPTNGLVHESSFAYPSGHAMVSGAAMAIGLAVLAGYVWPNRYRLFLWVGIAYAVVMAWSRTYLRAHWLTDVVGGLLFGTAIALLVGALLPPAQSRTSVLDGETEERGDARGDI